MLKFSLEYFILSTVVQWVIFLYMLSYFFIKVGWSSKFNVYIIRVNNRYIDKLPFYEWKPMTSFCMKL